MLGTLLGGCPASPRHRETGMLGTRPAPRAPPSILRAIGKRDAGQVSSIPSQRGEQDSFLGWTRGASTASPARARENGERTRVPLTTTPPPTRARASERVNPSESMQFIGHRDTAQACTDALSYHKCLTSQVSFVPRSGSCGAGPSLAFGALCAVGSYRRRDRSMLKARQGRCC